MNVLVIGAGQMAAEHIKVLDALEVNYTIVGRGKTSANLFKDTYGKNVIAGGIESVYEELKQNFTHAIIATPLENLEENALFLLEKKVSNILLEKPGAVTIEGIEKLRLAATENSAKVVIAYNRRFYSSVMEAKKRIIEEGGITSFLFEFTEWSHQIEKLNKSAVQLENWFIGNSTHVLDTAFYLGGVPKVLQGFNQSKLDWHPQGSIFVGSGITEQEIPFSYHANWNGPGSWKLEILTNANRYIFRPFEQLHVQKRGEISIGKINIDDNLDKNFKPGLFKQLQAFLYNKNSEQLLDIDKAYNSFVWYKKILENGGVTE